jgi:hypothetical protein
MKLVIAALVLLPSYAQAELIYISYEGRVNRLEGPSSPEYRLGDKISGRLTIDLLLAPLDANPGSLESGLFTYVLDQPHHDWLTGYTGPGGTAFDGIFTTNSPSGDFWVIADTRGPFNHEDYLSVQMTVGGIELFPTDQLDQFFRVTRADQPASFAGSFRSGVGETARYVGFALHKLSVIPGRCRK